MPRHKQIPAVRAITRLRKVGRKPVFVACSHRGSAQFGARHDAEAATAFGTFPRIIHLDGGFSTTDPLLP